MRSGKQPAGAAGEASHTDPLKNIILIVRKKKKKMKEKEIKGKKKRRKLRTPHVNPRVAGAMGSVARSTPAAPALSA